MTSTDPPTNGAELPAQPGGTRHDGDPSFEALVYGFLLSGEGYNGEYPFGDKGTDPRPDLAGHFEQYLEQAPEGHDALSQTARQLGRAREVRDRALDLLDTCLGDLAPNPPYVTAQDITDRRAEGERLRRMAQR